ncbi:hypothetical protein GCM10023195_22650 [Actinoallomurus liliacearum]|uniref:Orn/DAP/Arg decarboxylase 2 C-terminal domain-containing protein n=1 Tax=Actinoallomurus liliacearum TaxID=1080073 RepID=A0ABP8THH4_9ACTN
MPTISPRFAIGDVVAFSMAGAYAWNISHQDFLPHPKPGHHYLGDDWIRPPPTTPEPPNR